MFNCLDIAIVAKNQLINKHIFNQQFIMRRQTRFYKANFQLGLIYAAIAIIMAMANQCFGQEVTLTLKDSTVVKTKITAISGTTLHTPKGAIKKDDVAIADFPVYREFDESMYQDLKERGVIIAFKGITEKKEVYISGYVSKNSLYLDDMPFDEQGNLIYTDVVQLPGTSKNELYLRGKHFFTNAFKSANDVVQFDDKEAGVTTGKGFSEILINVGLTSVATRLYYTIKIESKDDRYKYTIQNLFYKSYRTQYTSEIETPAEGMFLKKDFFKSNNQPRQLNLSYKIETGKTMQRMVNLIKEEMNKPVKSDDW